MKKLGAVFSAVLFATWAGAGEAMAQDAASPDAPADKGGAGGGSGISGKSCGDLLIIYDRSNSMNLCSIDGQTKEDISRQAMRDVSETYRNVPMGLMVFPNTLSAGASGCAVGTVVVDIGPDGSLDVRAFMDSMPKTSGGTPTGATLEVAASYANWTPGLAHFVLLMTDGQPTCNEAPNCLGTGSQQCANPTRAYDAITKMYNSGIRTFVVGFEGAATCTVVSSGFDPNTLNHMAELGGLPQEGASSKYYSAVDSASLLASLKSILGKVVNGGGTVQTEHCATGYSTDGGTGQDGGGGKGGYAGGSGASGGGSGSGGAAGGGARRINDKPGGCGCHSGSGDVGVPALLLSALSAAVVLRRRRPATARVKRRSQGG